VDVNKTVSIGIVALALLGAATWWTLSSRDIGMKQALERDEPRAPASVRKGGADLEQPRSSRAQPTTAAAVSPVRLRVTSARTNAPLAGARIEFASADGAHATIATDTEGIALLPHEGVYALRVSAAGHLACAGRLTIPASATLALAEPDDGVVALRFVDEAGLPVAGVETELVEPEDLLASPSVDPSELASALDASTPKATLRALIEMLPDPPVPPRSSWTSSILKSDAQGKIEWSGVPSGPGWRWRLASKAHLKWTPAQDAKSFEVLIDDRPALSGPFMVGAGISSRFDEVVLDTASVRGVLLGCDGKPQPDVVLSMYGQPPVLRTERRARWVPDGDVRTRDDGSFAVGGLSGGPRRITGTWSQPGRGTALFETTFDLDPAQHRDLGPVQPGGVRVQVRVILVDRDGNDVTSTVRRPDDSSNIGLSLVRPNENVQAAETPVSASLGTSVAICGLAPQAYELSLATYPTSDWLRKGWDVIEELELMERFEVRDFDAASTSEVVLGIPVSYAR
jgi:hypothetical protein